MQPLQVNAEINCKFVSGNVEVRLEHIENIVERNPRRTRLNRYPDLRTWLIQPVIKLAFRIEQERTVFAVRGAHVGGNRPRSVFVHVYALPSVEMSDCEANGLRAGRCRL